MGVSKTSDHIQIKIKMQNPGQEPPTSSKAPNDDLKEMDVLCNFKIKIDSTKILNKAISKTSGHIQIKIKMPYLRKEPPVSSKAPNQDLNYIYVLFTFKIQIKRQNLVTGCTNNQ